MAIVNLHTKYAKEVQQRFQRDSRLKKSENQVDFTGAKTAIISTVGTVPLNDYNPNADNAYGQRTQIPDQTQEMTMRFEKSFSAKDDKTYSIAQCYKKVPVFLKEESQQEIMPTVDMLSLVELAHNAGTVYGVTAAITASNVKARLKLGRKALRNAHVKMKRVDLYVSTDTYDAMLDMDEFKTLEALGIKALREGEVGRLFGATVVEVEDDVWPAGVNFIYAERSAYTNPIKLNELKVNNSPESFSGTLINGLIVFDCFVHGSKAGGVYADVTAVPCAAPTVTASTGAITVASDTIVMYTTDGSDPRYSTRAVTITSTTTPAGLTSGQVVKAFAYKTGGFCPVGRGKPAYTDGQWPSGVTTVKKT